MVHRSRLRNALVAWYAIYQAVHGLVNVRGLFLLGGRGTIDFPAPPPPDGWQPQAIAFFFAIASLDLLNAWCALCFAWGYYRRRAWANALGLVVLTVSVYAALLFDYATIAAGAWQGVARYAYLFINVTFIPVVGLYVVWLRQAFRP
jgi:hypothetical protein